MNKKLSLCRTSLSLCLVAVVAVIAALPTSAFAANFAATSPWVAGVASFILGDSGTVRNLASLNAYGSTVMTSYARTSEHVLALDVKDARRFGVRADSNKVHLLYESMPMTDAEFVRGFFDPATLPFVAQMIMKAVTKADPKRYSYYQRRLAEFQSRIESTQETGRYLLEKTHILDLTGAEGYWIRSVSSTVIRPPGVVWRSWLNGDTVALRAAIDEAARRKWLILLDTWTPAKIRAVALTCNGRLTLPLPTAEQDFFLYLHNIFLTIRDRAAAVAAKK